MLKGLSRSCGLISPTILARSHEISSATFSPAIWACGFRNIASTGLSCLPSLPEQHHFPRGTSVISRFASTHATIHDSLPSLKHGIPDRHLLNLPVFGGSQEAQAQSTRNDDDFLEDHLLDLEHLSSWRSNSEDASAQFFAELSETDLHDRRGLFSALRSVLIHDHFNSRLALYILERYFLSSDTQTQVPVKDSERAILIEVLRKILEDFSEGNSASSKWLVPLHILEKTLCVFAQDGVLTPQAWAYCLNSLAYTTYHAFLEDFQTNVAPQVRRAAATAKLLNKLLRAWKIFFSFHQETAGSSKFHVWPFLSEVTEDSTSTDKRPGLTEAFLDFAPGWLIQGDPNADLQLTSAMVMTMAALLKSIRNITPNIVCFPSSWIDWGTAVAYISVEPNTTKDSLAQGIPQRPERYSLALQLTIDQASMLFVMAQVYKRANPNYALLRIVLARKISPAVLSTLTETLQTFMAATTTFFEVPNDEKRLEAPQTPALSMNAQSMLEHEISNAKSLGELEKWVSSSSKLRSTIPHIDMLEVHKAIMRRAWKLAPTAEAEVVMWDSAKHWWGKNAKMLTERLQFYFKRNDLSGFQHAEEEILRAPFSGTEKIIGMKIHLLFTHGFSDKAVRLFFDRLRLVAKKTQVRTARDRAWKKSLTTATVNMLIRNLLIHGQVDEALHVKHVTEKFPHLFGCDWNRTSWQMFRNTRSWLRADRIQRAVTQLRIHQSPLDRTSIAFCYDLIKQQLTRWPLCGPYGEQGAILCAFNSALRLKDQDGKPRSQPLHPAAFLNFHEDHLKSQRNHLTNNPDFPSLIAAATKEHTLSWPLRKTPRDYLWLMKSFVDDFPVPINIRLLMLLWTHCLLSGVLPSQEMLDFVLTAAFGLPYKQQLQLLNGEIYGRKSRGPHKYRNFTFVREHFGPAFIAKCAETVGVGPENLETLRKIPWTGFEDAYRFELSRLTSDIRILKEFKRLRLEELDMRIDAYKLAMKHTPKIMRDGSGMWLLHAARSDKTGILRTVPMVLWAEEADYRKETQVSRSMSLEAPSDDETHFVYTSESTATSVSSSQQDMPFLSAADRRILKKMPLAQLVQHDDQIEWRSVDIGYYARREWGRALPCQTHWHRSDLSDHQAARPVDAPDPQKGWRRVFLSSHRGVQRLEVPGLQSQHIEPPFFGDWDVDDEDGGAALEVRHFENERRRVALDQDTADAQSRQTLPTS